MTFLSKLGLDNHAWVLVDLRLQRNDMWITRVFLEKFCHELSWDGFLVKMPYTIWDGFGNIVFMRIYANWFVVITCGCFDIFSWLLELGQ